MIVDGQIDRRHAATVFLDHGPSGAQVDQRGENAAVGVAAVRIDDPLFPPGRLQFDAALVQRNDFETQPLMVGGPGDQRLHSLPGELLTHGVTTSLPMASRSWIGRSLSRACSSGSTLSIPGRILPSAMSFISARRSSS